MKIIRYSPEPACQCESHCQCSSTEGDRIPDKDLRQNIFSRDDVLVIMRTFGKMMRISAEELGTRLDSIEDEMRLQLIVLQKMMDVQSLEIKVDIENLGYSTNARLEKIEKEQLRPSTMQGMMIKLTQDLLRALVSELETRMPKDLQSTPEGTLHQRAPVQDVALQQFRVEVIEEIKAEISDMLEAGILKEVRQRVDKLDETTADVNAIRQQIKRTVKSSNRVRDSITSSLKEIRGCQKEVRVSKSELGLIMEQFKDILAQHQETTAESKKVLQEFKTVTTKLMLTRKRRVPSDSGLRKEVFMLD